MFDHAGIASLFLLCLYLTARTCRSLFRPLTCLRQPHHTGDLSRSCRNLQSTSIGTQSKETGSNNAVERLPSITQESPKDSKPTSIPGETSHVAEAPPAEALVSALVSLAAASQNAAKATKPGETTDNNPDGDAGHQQSASDGGIEQSETQSIENLLSALQGVASHAATS